MAQGYVCLDPRFLSEEEIMVDKKPTWQFKIVPIVGAVLCVIWVFRVWRGDNPADTTVLMILGLITVASSVYAAAMIKKRDT
jgi:hypothetical protein